MGSRSPGNARTKTAALSRGGRHSRFCSKYKNFYASRYKCSFYFSLKRVPESDTLYRCFGSVGS
ncbi:hypothetical protein D3C87_1710210 [compost metagenome]